ncbi:sulfatase [Bacteroidia bacterium]|nr:sulfatase [Bacteroidia bacterium]
MNNNCKYAALPLAALSICCVDKASAAGVGKAQKPNLVFVLVDDLGWGALGLNKSMYDYGQLNREFIKLHVKDYTPEQAQQAAEQAMPTLASLCRQGTRFTSAYATANVSSPSRAGLMTSRYQERFGYYINGEQNAGVPLTEKLMPQYLKSEGYTCACIGKYHLAPNPKGDEGGCTPGFNPLDRGFDYYWGFNSHGTQYYDSDMLYRGRERVKASGYLTDELTREALGFIDRAGNQPFVLYLAYNAVHGPLGAPAPGEYLSRFNYASKALNNFYAYVYAVDQGVKKIVDKLSAEGKLDNTMIVFTSDNGAPGGATNVLPKNGPFRGFKGQTWQGGVRIPMFIYAPGLKGGGRCASIVSTMDIFPTFMDYAGVARPKNIDGRSLLPALAGNENYKVRNTLVWMSQNAQNWGMYNIKDQSAAPGGFMVREDNWTLRYDTVESRFYLFDLDSDMGEQTDLADKYPDRVESMKGIFRAWFSQMEKPMVWKPQLWERVQYWKYIN